MHLPSSFASADDTMAADHLRTYYGLAGTPPFDGATFDTWDPSGNRAEDTDRFTSDDFTALPFLSIDPEARTLKSLLGADADRASALLADLPRDLAFYDADIDWLYNGAPTELWKLVRRSAGPTTVSKLMARKRPLLFPIRDSLVDRALGTTAEAEWWRPLHALWNGNSGALQTRINAVRSTAGVDADLPSLRVFDVIAWMDGKYS
ncbi:MAG: DUF6308 family protein [Nakamurella sp.]